jgi:hypothetical protein
LPLEWGEKEIKITPQKEEKCSWGLSIGFALERIKKGLVS